jgi:cytoskeletal protein CcmA (bactofilin family)
MASKSSDSSVLGPQTEVRGNISGQGGLRVDGKVQGNVSVDGALEISAGASITGDVSGASLKLDGSLLGDIDSQGPVSIGPRAEYRGVLKGERIAVAPGARVSAQIDTQFDLNLDI